MKRALQEGLSKSGTIVFSIGIMATILSVCMIVLAACSAVVSLDTRTAAGTIYPLPPSYMVKITNNDGSSYCGGVVYKARYVITASHCSKFAVDVSTQYGKVVPIESVVFDDPLNDIAVLRAKHNIFNVYEPVFSDEIDPNEPVLIYGHCPKRWAHIPIVGLYVGRLLYRGTLVESFNVEVCPGDSGGVVMQNGKVVGLVIIWVEDGFTYARSGALVKKLVGNAIEGDEGGK